jgi:hypothetical protein
MPSANAGNHCGDWESRVRGGKPGNRMPKALQWGAFRDRPRSAVFGMEFVKAAVVGITTACTGLQCRSYLLVPLNMCVTAAHAGDGHHLVSLVRTRLKEAKIPHFSVNYYVS